MMEQRDIKPIKRRKSATKIPRNPLFAVGPRTAEATWNNILISERDVLEILKKLEPKIALRKTEIIKVSENIQIAINLYIQNWIFQKQSLLAEFTDWAQNIADAAQLLLACLGVDPSKNWCGISLETKYNLLIEGKYNWDTTPRIMQERASLPDDCYQAIEQAGMSIFVIREIALEAVKGYQHASAMKKKEKELLNQSSKSHHQANKALQDFFARINALYKLITGKEPTATNGSKLDGYGKSNTVRFATSILDLAAVKVEKSALEGETNSESDMTIIAKQLKTLSLNPSKIIRLMRTAINQPLHKD